MFGLFRVAWWLFWFPTFLVLGSLTVVLVGASWIVQKYFNKYDYGAPFGTDLLLITLRIKSILVNWVDLFDKSNNQDMEEHMGLFGLKTNEVHDYVVTDQANDPKDDQVKFQVSFLTSKQLSDIQNNLFKIEGFGKNRQERLETGTQTLQTLITGLKGWKNFKFEDGGEVSWDEPKGNIAEQRETLLNNIDKIPPKYRDELAAHIRGESTVGND